MQFHRYDTSGEIPARISFALGLTALVIVLFAPLLPERAGDERSDDRVTLIEREGAAMGLRAAGLTAGTALPFLLRRSPMFKVSQQVAAVGLGVGVLLTITTVGLFYVPSAGLMILAATRHPPRDPFR